MLLEFRISCILVILFKIVYIMINPPHNFYFLNLLTQMVNELILKKSKKQKPRKQV
jgi:hypothetical protein